MLLDAGKSLFKGSNGNNQKESSLVIAQGIAKAYMEMEYDAVAISASDIIAGKSFLDQTRSVNFPWISANLIDENGQPAVATHIIKNVNGLQIGITGLTDNITQHSPYSVVDYHETLGRIIKELTDKTDIIILLSNLSGQVNKQIASDFTEINTIISSDRALGKMAPIVVNNTLITQTSSRGKYLGKLNITWTGGKEWYNERLLPLSELKKRKDKIELQLTQLISKENNQPSNNKKKISRLQLQEKRLNQEINDRMMLDERNGNQPYNKHRLSFIPVQPSNIPKSIQSIVNTIDEKTTEITHK